MPTQFPVLGSNWSRCLQKIHAGHDARRRAEQPSVKQPVKPSAIPAPLPAVATARPAVVPFKSADEERKTFLKIVRVATAQANEKVDDAGACVATVEKALGALSPAALTSDPTFALFVHGARRTVAGTKVPGVMFADIRALNALRVSLGSHYGASAGRDVPITTRREFAAMTPRQQHDLCARVTAGEAILTD